MVFSVLRSDVSYVVVVFGEYLQGMDQPVDLATFTSGQYSGFRIYGADPSFGTLIQAAGDLNGDAYMDFFVGGAGVSDVYAIFGFYGRTADISINAFTESHGLVISGFNTGWTLRTISSAGDMNNDGLADIIVGLPEYSRDDMPHCGMVLVLFGPFDTPTVDIDAALVSTPFEGIRIYGAAVDDLIGHAVTAGRDINNDGVPDLLIGAPYGLNQGVSVVFGNTPTDSDPDFSFEYNLPSSTDASGFHRGYRIFSTSGQEQLGHSVSFLGDVNGDGWQDFAFSVLPVPLPSEDLEPVPESRSVAVIIYGTGVLNADGSELSDIQLDMLTPLQGFTVHSLLTHADQVLPVTVAAAHDVNLDGYADILVGVPNVGSNGKDWNGAVFVLYGWSNTLDTQAVIELQNFVGDTTTGCVLVGASTGDAIGSALSASSGDYNTGVYGYLLIGASAASMDPGRTQNGALYVVNAALCSQPNAPTDDLPTDDLPTDDPYTDDLGTGGPPIGFPSEEPTDAPSDMPTDAPTAEPSFRPSARLSAGGCVDLQSFYTSASTGYRITNIDASEQQQMALASGVDLNGDGYPDTVVATRSATRSDRYMCGEVTVLYGQNRWTQDIDMYNFVTSPQTGFRIIGAHLNQGVGASITLLGDVNGDKINDFALTVTSSDIPGVGSTNTQGYVIYGRSADWNGGTSLDIDLATLDATQGFAIVSPVPVVIASAGDVNGDKLDDLFIGIPTYSNAVTNCVQCGAALLSYNRTIDMGHDLDLSMYIAQQSLEHSVLLRGSTPYEGLGTSILTMDLNHDNLTDFVLSTALGVNKVYIINGVFPIYNIDFSPGLTNFGVVLQLPNIGGDYVPIVNKIGDINGDARADIAITLGATSYVIFGHNKTY
eukprot:gene10995-12824_t